MRPGIWSASEKTTRQAFVSGSQPGKERPPMATLRWFQAYATRRAQNASSTRSFALRVAMRTRIFDSLERSPAPCQVPFSSKTSTTAPFSMAAKAGSAPSTSPSNTQGCPALSERAALRVTVIFG